jgi:hypothetical protein
MMFTKGWFRWTVIIVLTILCGTFILRIVAYLFDFSAIVLRWVAKFLDWYGYGKGLWG